MIAISSNPTKISAGGIVDLSLSTFGNVSFLNEIQFKFHLFIINFIFIGSKNIIRILKFFPNYHYVITISLL